MADNLHALQNFREINATFPFTGPVDKWKGDGGKVVGWLCTYVPEELIHAAGALPVRVTGGYQELMLEEATAYLGIMMCSFARSCLQLAMDGQYDYLDGLVGVAACEGSRHLAEVWDHYIKKTPLIEILPLPHKMDSRAEHFFREEVELFKQKLEAFLAVQISDQALRQSIALYNRHRQLLQQLNATRKLANPPVSGSEVLEITNACASMPKELANAMLEDLLQEINSTRRELQGKIRLMLSGCILNNPDFIRAIEAMGGLVVVDELCTGVRYWSDQVEISEGMSPMDALARRYLTKFPCARMNPFNTRLERLLPLINDYQVDGVVTRAIRYCKPYIHEQHLLRQALDNRGVPVLDLDVEYGMPGTGQIKTRVQAFIEMLVERKQVS